MTKSHASAQRLSEVAVSKELRVEPEGEAQPASLCTTQVGTAPNAGLPSPSASFAELTGANEINMRDTLSHKCPGVWVEISGGLLDARRIEASSRAGHPARTEVPEVFSMS